MLGDKKNRFHCRPAMYQPARDSSSRIRVEANYIIVATFCAWAEPDLERCEEAVPSDYRVFEVWKGAKVQKQATPADSHDIGGLETRLDQHHMHAQAYLDTISSCPCFVLLTDNEHRISQLLAV